MSTLGVFLTLWCILLLHVASGVETDKISVMVGDSVTLHTDVKINQKDRMKWFYNVTRIAQSIGHLSTCTDVQCNEGTERFRGRLKLDNQTGSLTIMNITTTDSGPYQLQITISSSSSSTDHRKIFKVTVNDVPTNEMKSVNEGESVTLDPGEINDPNYLTTWLFNNVHIAEINGNLSKTCIDGRFRDRLEVNQTGCLTIMNTKTTDSGVYKALINTSSNSCSIRRIRSFNVTVTGSGPSSAAIAGISASVLLLMASAPSVFYIHKRSKSIRLEHDQANTKYSSVSQADADASGGSYTKTETAANGGS